MAIKRCPYCKAIIDDGSEYCSNCGTQLLFPEDEFIEEEIPGDRIVEEDKPEDEALKEEEEVEEPEEKAEEPSLPAPSDESAEKEPEEAEAPQPEAEKTAEEKEAFPQGEKIKFKTEDLDKLPDARTKDQERIGKILESLKGEKAEGAPVIKEDKTPPLEGEKGVPEPVEKETPEEQAEEIKGEEKPPSPAPPEKAAEEPEKEPTPPKETQEIKGEDLEELSDAEIRERKDVERFVEAIKKERAEKAREEGAEEITGKGVTPQETAGVQKILGLEELEEKEKEDVEKFVESVKEEREEKTGESLTPEEEIHLTPEGTREGTSEVTDVLPPWAEKIKESVPPEFVDTQEEIAIEGTPEVEEEVQEEEEEAPEVEPTIPEIEVGLPERLGEKSLPLKKKAKALRRRNKRRRPSKLFIWLKSRAFDLLSIAAFWLVSLWLASRVVGVSLRQLISISTLPAIVFYVILLVVYFSFYLIFLGKTLGDYLFSRE